MAIDMSVVVATFNRGPLLHRLLRQLGEQTLASGRYEVVVVDDGSHEPVTPIAVSYALRIERQANSGPAMARDRGARLAQGRVLVLIDDDMQVPKTFLEAHWQAHATRPRAQTTSV